MRKCKTIVTGLAFSLAFIVSTSGCKRKPNGETKETAILTAKADHPGCNDVTVVQQKHHIVTLSVCGKRKFYTCHYYNSESRKGRGTRCELLGRPQTSKNPSRPLEKR